MKNSQKPLKIDLQNLLGNGLTQSEMVFASSTDEEEVFHQEELIQLEPFGMTLNPDPNHPFLLLRSQDQKQTLSVMLNPLEAGVTLTQSNKAIAPVTPHRFAQMLMHSLDIKLLQCVFVQIKGTHQYVRLYFSGHPSLNSLKLRADEVMSLVLHLGIPLFASPSFIERSKVLSAKLEGMTQTLMQAPKIPHKNQSYVI